MYNMYPPEVVEAVKKDLFERRPRFNAEKVFNIVSEDWKKFAESIHVENIVVGISGGIDSTCVATMACKIFGKEHVIGVSLPCDGQKDIADVDKVFAHLGIKRITIDIGDAFNSIVNGIENNAIEPSYDTKTNLPARLRMSALYAVAQSVKGLVTNNCQLSENICGYATLFGDSAGSYAPIEELTKTEVKQLAAWLGVPSELVNKTPIDGLQPLSDEEKLGFTYADLDNFIRNDAGTPEFKQKILEKYNANKFKTEIIQIPHPKFELPDYVSGYYVPRLIGY